MQQYHNMLQLILDEGTRVPNRTGIDTLCVFGYQTRFDLAKGFPAVTTKKLAWKAVVSELLWFLEGSTDERRLAEILYQDKAENLIGKQTIWTANADKQGKDLGYENTDISKELGPIYSAQWREYVSFSVDDGVITTDQIKTAIHDLKENKESRRIIVSAWDAGNIKEMALPPCHCFFQLRVLNNKLSCQVYIRSDERHCQVIGNEKLH